VADAAADTVEILDALGAGAFFTLGWSGGGPHALACAALLPDRCLAAASLAGVAPYRAEGLSWLDGMGDENLEEFGLAEQGPAALTPFLEREATKLGAIRAEDVADALGTLVSDIDRSALTGEFAEFSASSMRHALSSGIAGWRDDDIAFTRPWGFDLASITRPVAVWQGGQDRMVPFAHGTWLAAHVSGARSRLHPAEGHLSLGVARIGDIVEDLTEIGRMTQQ
jgi:pimeloyl-ACP methyl ester carboxylesterase